MSEFADASGLNVVLVSNDETLIQFCREILFEYFGTEWKLETGPAGSMTSPAGPCLWDIAPGDLSLPYDLRSAELHKHWFIVHRNDLEALHQALGRLDLNVLLKPVTRATMQTFLRGIAQQQDERNDFRDERDEMLQFLIQANLRLQEYEQQRSNFLARSVHDFHSPLTAISGYCGLLLEEALGPLTQEQSDVLGRMQRSAARLSRIANAMFNLSVPHNLPTPEPKVEEADIRDCVDQALHELCLLIEEKDINISMDIEPPPEGLRFEKSQIEQALVNLLDNACKFTPRNGRIEIKGYPFFWDRRTGQPAPLDQKCDRRTKQVRIVNSFRVDIRDSGPGIPVSDLDRLFQEYSSYSGGRDRSGGGLGLAICRMILQRHQGCIWAESNSTGAVFSFVLPLYLQTNQRMNQTNSIARGVHLAGRGDY